MRNASLSSDSAKKIIKQRQTCFRTNILFTTTIFDATTTTTTTTTITTTSLLSLIIIIIIIMIRKISSVSGEDRGTFPLSASVGHSAAL